jgi:hypothetical protein
MVEQLDISLVERQRCVIELWNPTTHPSACGDDAMRRAAVFKWWKRFRDGETNVKIQNRLFHYTPGASGKRPAARFRGVRGAL